MYKVTYLDNNAKSIQADEEEEDVDDRPITYHFDKVKSAVEPTIEPIAEPTIVPIVEPTIEPIAETKKPKKRFFQKIARILGFSS
jgi:hypothetical protein